MVVGTWKAFFNDACFGRGEDLDWPRLRRLEASGEGGGEGEAAREADEIMARTDGWTYKISAYAASNIAKRMENLVEDTKPKS